MRLLKHNGWILIFSMVTLAVWSGCGGYETPRTREDIFEDQLSVETLYFTEDGAQIRAPGAARGMIVDTSSGKLAYAAWQCDNPNCPGRAADGSPYLFPLPDPFAYVDDEGQPAIRQPQTEADFILFDEFIQRRCPKCLETRSLSSETEAEKQTYQGYVTRHITPQAKARLAELEKEMQAYLQRNQPTN